MNRKAVNKKMIIILAGIMTLAFAVFPVLLLSSGIFTSSRYLEPWEKNYSMQFDDPRIRLVSHGILAANGHNMQPWKVRLDPDDPLVFYLYADADRLTPEVDPFARQTLVSQGAFLEYVKIAGDKLGYETKMTLFPKGDYDEQNLQESMKTTPVAKVALTKASPQTNVPLYDYMFLPDTNRAPYKEKQLTDKQVNVLQSIPVETDLSLQLFQSKNDVNRLGYYAIEGAKKKPASIALTKNQLKYSDPTSIRKINTATAFRSKAKELQVL